MYVNYLDYIHNDYYAKLLKIVHCKGTANMSVKNVKKVSWYQVVWVLATRCNDYRYLLSLICDYRKSHPKIKSLNRLAYYVLKSNYSTTLMFMLAFCADHIDEFMKWKEEYALLSSTSCC